MIAFMSFAVFGLWAKANVSRVSSAKTGGSANPETPMRAVPDPGVITTNQTISPAGAQSIFESRVYGIAFGGAPGQVYAATANGIYELDWQSNKILGKGKIGSSGLQGITYDAMSDSVLMTAIRNGNTELVSKWNGDTEQKTIQLGKNEIAQIAVSRGAKIGPRYAVVALTFEDQAAIVDLNSGQVISKVRTGIAPFGATLDAAGTTAWVSNWGGRFPHPGDLIATTGSAPGADEVVVDSRGVAASGTISKIDVKTGAIVAQIEVGLHPTSLALDQLRHRLYVSNSNSDTISVVDTQKNAVVETIPLHPFVRDVVGVAPESLVLSRDRSHLYVACAGINAIAVLALKNNNVTMKGLIPTGWYPDAVTLSPDEKYLGVATLLGVGSGWKNAPVSGKTGAGYIRGCPGGQASPSCRYVHSYRGSIQVIPLPDGPELQRYSRAVAENNHLQLRGTVEAASRSERGTREMPVPLQAGDPSPIKHIIYIIKENRSYDQFFGGLGKGNGDPSLQDYSDDVIPNHRKLVRDFVLLDNFYATGGNSGDGHQWATQSNETDYTYLPGYTGRGYPHQGDDPMADARGGFIWNAVVNAGKTFIDFGEHTHDVAQPGQPSETRRQFLEDFRNGATFEGRFTAIATVASLNSYLAKDYPSWEGPDVARARIFIRHLKQWDEQASMPDLIMADLPSDHTAGTTPGYSTPRACMADNDYALGMIVDAVSHSKFWASTLILVVEDDAQNGLDHVDGHRTVALAISPYIKRGVIDSTFYSHPSMLKTIELIMGLPNLSMFDLIANDMRNSFQDKPDFTPYSVEIPKQSIYEVNAPLQALSGQARKDAEASLHMNFSEPDAAPTENLNRILWRAVRGATAPYPQVQHAAFVPYSNDLDDDAKEESYGKK